jgi:hypothetical protein
MYTVENSNGQLKLSYSNLVEFYQFPTFKSVSFAFDTVRSNYYVSINFIANDKNNSLRLYLVDVTNQPTWTDNAAGAKNAVGDISSWIAAAISPAFSGVTRKALTRRISGAAATINDEVYTISFASVGTGNVTISSNSGTSFDTLKPGETVSFDAGDINNKFSAGDFQYNATALNAEILIVYTY